jgi:protocatechuate 3,4-dioxygenase beta subunit
MVGPLTYHTHTQLMTGILSPANATGMYGGYTATSFETSASGTFNSSETWLRGGWYTDANGIAEVTTIYPDYYDDRAPHIHLMVHKDWVQSANGLVHVVP